MQTVIIPRKEYDILLESKLKFDYLHQILTTDVFSPPPTRDIDEITTAFFKTGKYNKPFINSLKKGLQRSSYFKNR